ncbi:MAG: sensor histidine kinase [Chloroflexi bacterium]|nr:sensor histidine kinase [Chloroflexota bacterium]
MLGLISLLIYMQFQRHQTEKEDGDEDLKRLAVFVAHAERERFIAAERLLTLAKQAEPLRAMAANPESQQAFDRCTSSLFVLDQLLPGTSGFALWDTSGRALCSSKGAKVGEYNVADHLWFQHAVARGDVATGDYEEAPPDNLPNLAFGAPIFDPGGNIVAYLSTGLRVDDTDDVLAGANLPDTGRVFVVDQNGVIVNSSIGMSGQQTVAYNERFGSSLRDFLDVRVNDTANGLRAAAVRVTDADDTAVSVVVSADPDSLAPPLIESLWGNLWPVALVTMIILPAVWFLSQRWIVRPVVSLVDASDAISAGKLDARVSIKPGIAEFERLAASFNEMAENRERATHAKDEFLGLVSHELKTPITMVLGNAEILRRQRGEVDADSLQSALDDIFESGERLSAIVENLLALARLERGAGLAAEPLALLRMAEASAAREQHRFDERTVRVTGDRSVLVLAGDVYVEQVLQNLISNALKYSTPGAPVDVLIERDGDSGVVRVLDRGRGIDEAEREAVFEPFYRADNTAQGTAGIGIGLSVCKRLIEALGGRIWCAEREGGGTEFGFALPLVAEEAPAGPSEAEYTPPVESGPTAVAAPGA